MPQTPIRLVLPFCLAVGLSAQIQNPVPLSVVSAASYEQRIAPGSIATIFGTDLGTTAVSAALDESGRLPLKLGGTVVEVNGSAVSIFYVSRTQVNCLIPDDAALGGADFLVRSREGAVVSRGTARIELTAPAIFTADASGTGAGAILNAVTYSRDPFVVETAEIPGNDKRTRMAIYATGVRWAGNPDRDLSRTNAAGFMRAVLTLADRTQIELPVEFAGAAPGFFGLDQVNVVLPPETDATGTPSLNLLTPSASNTVTVRIGRLPDNALRVAGLELAKPVLTGGAEVMGTATLNAPARAGGLRLEMRASSPAAIAPADVAIPQGSVQTTFRVRTNTVVVPESVTLTASGGAGSAAATLRVEPEGLVRLKEFSVTPDSSTGGRTVTGVVTLTGPAPPGGAEVAIRSDIAAAQPPATVLVRQNEATARFEIPMASVSAPKEATITASYRDFEFDATILLKPVFTLTLGAPRIVGGADLAGSVALGEPAPLQGAFVTLKADGAGTILPAFLLIRAGESGMGFKGRTMPVTAKQTVTVTAGYGALTQTAVVTVTPPTSNVLDSIGITPGVIEGGGTAMGTVTLEGPAPAGGAQVRLTSDNPAAQPPLFATVPGGESAVQFEVRTVAVTSTQTAVISATSGGITLTAVLKVN